MNSAASVRKRLIPKKKGVWDSIWRHRWLYIILTPGLVYFLVYKYLPMLGLVMAFEDYKPMFGFAGSPWVGLKHFQRFFSDASFWILLRNTLLIAVYNLALYFPFTIILAILLNELRSVGFKRFVQTATYMPHFFSWIVIASLSYKLLSQEVGMVNGLLELSGRGAIPFLASKDWFRSIIVVQGIWRDLGWGSIIFLAAIAAVDPQMYEVAVVEGANRMQRIWYVTLPAIKSTIITILILRLGRFLDLGFEQIYVQLNAMNRETGEIFDTYIYTMGVVGGQYSYNAAVGMFKSLVGVVLVVGSNMLARRFGEEGIY